MPFTQRIQVQSIYNGGAGYRSWTLEACASVLPSLSSGSCVAPRQYNLPQPPRHADPPVEQRPLRRAAARISCSLPPAWNPPWSKILRRRPSSSGGSPPLPELPGTTTCCFSFTRSASAMLTSASAPGPGRWCACSRAAAAASATAAWSWSAPRSGAAAAAAGPRVAAAWASPDSSLPREARRRLLSESYMRTSLRETLGATRVSAVTK
mmetsp:Transcript_31321/g.69724  ORF Transcript_31321/g.69724 Transcript_31321/m.69724 type:complete len:209 (-) Transcript_31321:1874-2500(-)